MSKNDKRNHIKSIALAVAMALLPMASHAAGLGKITVHSALGQPLRAELEVTATKDETASLTAKVASADAFRLAGIEYSAALASIRFAREIKERGGRRYIELTTDRPLNEPFVDMLVELSWSAGRLVREYTFLLDPPELVSKTPPPAAVTPPEVKPEPAPVIAPAPAPVSVPAPAPAPVERIAPLTSVESQPPARMPAEVTPAKPVEKAPESTVLKSTTRLSKPAKAVAEETKAAADQPKEGRKVVSGDTLGKIASQTRHQGVSFDQMVVGLFRQNQDAFEGGNMNRLKAGKILAVPDADVVGQVPSDEARKEILAQAADFNAYRKKLAEAASAAPVKEQPAKQSLAGKITPKVEDKAPPATAGKDKLEVSRSEAAKGAKDAAGKLLPGRVASMEEDMVARGKALKEADSRIAELEKNIQNMKKLAEMKSQAGADLQKQALAAKAADAAPAKSAAATPPAPAVAATPAPTTQAPASADPASVADVAKPADAPKPPPKPKAPPPPPPEPEPTFMEENGPLVMGGGGLIALLLGWLGFSAYRKKRAARSAMQDAAAAEPDFSASSSFSSPPADVPPQQEQEVSQFSTTSTSIQSAATAEAMDPLSEADTFLAFGRDAQAEEILLEALKNDPTRQAIHLKLLDIYFGRKNVSQFAVIAAQLHALVSGTGDDWDRVATMGREIDPANVLYGGTGPVVPEAPAAPDFAATLVMQAPVLEMPPVEQAAASDEALPAGEPEAAALDFNLDLDAPEEAAPMEEKSEIAALDLDFDVQPPSAEEKPAAELDVMLETGKFEPPAAAPEEVLDLPLETLEVASEPDANSVDFEFEIKKPEAEAVSQPETSEVMSLDMPDLEMPEAKPEVAALDLGDLSLELETLPEPGAEAAAAPEAPAADNPEVTTKLELATAYEEMGDKDGARELYEEAIKDGSPAQQEQARAKLASLG